MNFTTEEARLVGAGIGIDWASAPFDAEQFRMGMSVELEHGLHDLHTNVSDSDPVVTGKIALAHLNEFPDYYTRLEQMENEAKQAMQDNSAAAIATGPTRIEHAVGLEPYSGFSRA
jgi:hypothetical protein